MSKPTTVTADLVVVALMAAGLDGSIAWEHGDLARIDVDGAPGLYVAVQGGRAVVHEDRVWRFDVRLVAQLRAAAAAANRAALAT
jgi:hypothetical protein